MRKKIEIMTICIAFSSIATSCSKDIISNLKNYKLENINEYTAIGYGSFGDNVDKSSANDGKKFTHARSLNDFYNGHEYATSPFALIGLKNGEIERLSFSDRSSSTSINVNQFTNLDSFYFFLPESGKMDIYTLYSQTYLDRAVCSYNSGGVNPCFLLSKNTGNIYQINGNDENDQFEICSITSGGGLMYAIAEDELLSDYLYRITEEDETLKVTHVKIENDYFNCIDKFGNMFCDNHETIISKDLKKHKFDEYFSNGHFFFNHSTRRIVWSSSDYSTFYVLDKDGVFRSSQTATKGMVIYKKDGEVVQFYSFEDIGQKIIYQGDEYVYALSSEYVFKYNIDSNKNYVFQPLENVYAAGGFRTRLSSAIRGDSIYWVSDSTKKLYRLNMSNDNVTSIETNYEVDYLTVNDTTGDIKVVGTDDYLNQYIGYLDMDDTISSEGKGTPTQDTYMLYPINN